MPDSFGARLRQRREERRIALSAIADDTKIKLTLLEGLERDDVSHWPSGIFRRAYIRAYAHMIGLDPDEVLREFLEVYPEPAAEAAAAAALAAAEEAARRNGAPPTRLRTMVDSALGSLVRLRRTGGDESHPPAVIRAEAAAEPVPNRLVVSDSEVAVRPGEATDEDTVPGISLERLQEQSSAAPAPIAAEQVAAQAPLDRTDEVPAGADPIAAPAQAVPDTPAAVAEPATPELPDRTAAAAIHSSLEAVAGLCTAFARVNDRNQVQLLLQEAARILDASGLIVWVWDGAGEALRPALVYGYSDRVLAQLPTVRRDADNATAAAFRSGQTCEMPGTSHSSGALVVPLLTPDGCAGVLALELQQGVTETRSVRATATILAAVLTQLVLRVRAADVRPHAPITPGGATFRSPVPPVRVRRNS